MIKVITAVEKTAKPCWMFPLYFCLSYEMICSYFINLLVEECDI